MVALKAAEIDGFVARLDPARPIILVFGPDAGLVRERVEAIIAKAVDDPKDPFTLARLDGDSLSGDPERLLDEAHTVPLFGGRRAVWVKAGGRNITPAVEALIAAPPGPDCRVVIEAGDLRRGAPLRTACERARNVAAIACYVDGERDLARLIDDEMRASGLTIAGDARAALTALLGGDRIASRSEVRKLALYARGQGSVELDDVLAVVADASALALDGVVDAAFAGRAPEVETQFAKARSAGTPASVIIGSASRHAAQLHRARTAIETGDAIDQALGEIRPAVHFRREPLVRSALAAWTAARLERVMLQFADTVLEARRRPALADALGQRALLSVALAARRRS